MKTRRPWCRQGLENSGSSLRSNCTEFTGHTDGLTLRQRLLRQTHFSSLGGCWDKAISGQRWPGGLDRMMCIVLGMLSLRFLKAFDFRVPVNS